jgi:hypothetical protein
MIELPRNKRGRETWHGPFIHLAAIERRQITAATRNCTKRECNIST